MTGRDRLTATGRLVATIVVLAGGEGVLAAAGRRLPPLDLDATRLSRTLDEAAPFSLAVSILRLGALGVGGGLLAVTAVGLVARAVGAVRLVRRLDRCTPPPLRRLLDGALGIGLAASIGLGPLAAAADPAPSPAVPATTLRRLPDAPPAPTADERPTTTLRRLPDGVPPPWIPPGSSPDPGPLGANPPTGTPVGGTLTEPAAEGSSAVKAGEVVVRPGDSFWRLSEHHVAGRLGRRPTEAEVGACWQEMVALNRSRLVVPGDPDLILPGQVLRLSCP